MHGNNIEELERSVTLWQYYAVVVYRNQDLTNHMNQLSTKNRNAYGLRELMTAFAKLPSLIGKELKLLYQY